MKKTKVHVKLFTQEQFFAYLYVKDDERVQDLLNDDRKFLPLEKSFDDRGRSNEDVYTHIVLNKDAIASIEER